MRTETRMTGINTESKNTNDMLASSAINQVVYKEMSDTPLTEVSIFEQLDQNLSEVENLTRRLQFMMREVRYLMKL